MREFIDHGNSNTEDGVEKEIGMVDVESGDHDGWGRGDGVMEKEKKNTEGEEEIGLRTWGKE